MHGSLPGTPGSALRARSAPLPAALPALLLLLAGCLGPAPQAVLQPEAPAGWPAGVHPFPHGDGREWPAGLEGPFALLETLHVQVPAAGVDLDGFVMLPAVPEGVRVPVVLVATPYLGQLYTTPGSPTEAAGLSLYPGGMELVEEGYAFAIFSIRGTGNSGGCFEFLGPGEQQDMALLVEWLAAQPWSNGRVAMMGGSYDGTTAWQAAIHNPPGLKAVIPTASLHDAYTFFRTPQGAALTIGGPFLTAYTGLVSLDPPWMGGPLHAGPGHVGVLPERLCPEVQEVLVQHWRGQLGQEVDPDFFDARRLTAGFPGITAAAWIEHGFQDRRSHQHGHRLEEDPLWALLAAPKRMVLGPWAHESPRMEDLAERRLAWLGFWLKGLGDAPPGVGLVEYEDNAGAWRESAAWPPAEARPEVLYLAGEALAPEPGPAPRAFRSVPLQQGPEALACGLAAAPPAAPVAAPALAQGGAAPGLVFRTEPLAEAVVLAGNPFAFLHVESDRPGGLLAVHLFDVPAGGCAGGPPRLLTTGAADLRHHAGDVAGTDFPVGAPTPVRVDLFNLAERVEAGHRLVAVASAGSPRDLMGGLGQPAPLLTLHTVGGPAASHVVLPLVEGTLGGASPTLDYPPRPFLPPAPRPTPDA